jgi:hypothetical protein
MSKKDKEVAVVNKKPVKKVVKKKVVKKKIKINNVMGRPKINPQELNVNWKADMLALYKEGKSDVSIRCNCFDRVISTDIWYRWIDELDDFYETVKQGKALCQDWWENLSQEHASGKNEEANATGIIFNMSNRFRNAPRGEENLWKQRQTVDNNIKAEGVSFNMNFVSDDK